MPEDLILNPKEHSDVKIGDIVEIYHPEDENFRLLLQISGFNEELKGRGECNACKLISQTNFHPLSVDNKLTLIAFQRQSASSRILRPPSISDRTEM